VAVGKLQIFVVVALYEKRGRCVCSLIGEEVLGFFIFFFPVLFVGFLLVLLFGLVVNVLSLRDGGEGKPHIAHIVAKPLVNMEQSDSRCR